MNDRRLKIRIVLEGLRSAVPSIELEDSFIIREPKEEELALLSGYDEHVRVLFRTDNGRERFKVLEREFPAEEPWTQWVRYRDQLEIVLTALRLIKGGTIGYRLSLYEIIPKPKNRDIPHPLAMFSPHQAAYAEGEYRLSEGDVEELRTFWSEIKEALVKGKELGALHLAISRFESSYLKAEHADKFIDLMISMEALYLKKEEKQELKYRLSQRAALLLEQDREKRIRTRNRIKKLYNKRSEIVHGNLDAASFEEVSELKDYVRTSLKKFLMLYCEYTGNIEHFMKCISEKLDELAVSSDFGEGQLLECIRNK